MWSMVSSVPTLCLTWANTNGRRPHHIEAEVCVDGVSEANDDEEGCAV
jgi:hypothetical protein